ncbi:MAG: hypothetical protein CSB28_01760 [Desulfobacterales bacterium]|nr:MAG: hypothetical protein CSB28_01760 [Desulfobacterales bacterium]
MTLFFYKSALCPRCALAGRYLDEIAQHHPGIKIEKIDILTSPSRCWQDGIRIIPALSTGEAKLPMLWPSRKAIIDFLYENKVI